MKKTALLLTALVLILASAFVVFAGEYSIYDHTWNSDYGKGRLSIEWEKCDWPTKYKVVVHRKGLNSSRQDVGTKVFSKTVSGKKIDVTGLIWQKGTGIYTYAITPVSSPSPLDDMVVGDEFEADAGFVDRVRMQSVNPDNPGSLTNVRWVKTPTGWAYEEGGQRVTSAWRMVDGFWYYFNGNGDMLTGWQWIGSRCYYLNPVENAGGYPLGACWMNRTTPDGYQVNSSGEWVVNGIPQTR